MPEHSLPAMASKPFTKGKPLSYNAQGNRAVTQVIQFPAGWRHDREHYIDSEEELYVIAGSLVSDGISYDAGTYANLPAGFIRKSQASPKGALILFYYDGPHRAIYEDPPLGMYQSARLIEPFATPELPWLRGNAQDRLAWGSFAERKLLRRDSQSGEETWLLRVPPDNPDVTRAPVVHANVEEMFILAGGVTTPRGTLAAGGYVWRAPGTPTGPSATRTGFTALGRSRGGALNTRATGPAESVDWSAAYTPHIAAEQLAWAFSEFDPSQMF